MLGIASGLFGLLGSGVKGFFGMKKSQQDTLQSGFTMLKDINATESQREAAIAQIILAEAQSDSWITRSWRPLTMVFFVSLLGGYIWGYIPYNLLKPVPVDSLMAEIFEIIKIGICGYIPARSLEKIVSTTAKTGVLKQLLNKYTK